MRTIKRESLPKNKKSVMSEKQTISSILALAREQGVEEKVMKIIEKYQDAVKGAKNEFERKHLAAMGLADIYRIIGCVGGLVVDGVEILPPDLSWQDDINAHKSIVRLD
jgi:fructose-1,6-bisphosphatase